MRNLHEIDQYRRTDAFVRQYYRGIGDETCGAFIVPSKIDKAPMMVVASSEAGWDHVSVSRAKRTPNWPEMCQIKELFFEDHETVMQLHVPPSDHINDHPHCLHLWRPQKLDIPRPPSVMVGGVSKEEAEKEIKRLMTEQAA